MKNQIKRSAALVLTVICLATFALLSRHYLPGEAMAQSQEKSQKWEYCYVSSPVTVGSSNGSVSTKVFVSKGGEKWLEDSDSTGVSALNRLGAEGWELVSASDELTPMGLPSAHPTTTRFLLKRPR